MKFQHCIFHIQRFEVTGNFEQDSPKKIIRFKINSSRKHGHAIQNFFSIKLAYFIGKK